jgi:hypothetical protein
MACADELSVNPEYTNADAYNTYLNAVFYPTNLPFDRWLTTARTYLNFLGSSLYDIKSAFQMGANSTNFTKGNPSGIALACEFLSISEVECIIVTGRDFAGLARSLAPLYQYYGYSGLTADSGLPWELDLAGVPPSLPPPNSPPPIGVENFLQRMAIAYDDLVALLKMRALNPSFTILLLATAGAPCDLTKTQIIDRSSTLPEYQLTDSPTLDLMHRFIRLWKKLDWGISDLDKTMTALGATDIDQQLVVSIAAIKQLQIALNLPLLEVLSFWSYLDTDGRDSLYLTLFQNKIVLNPPDPAFALNYSAPLATAPTLQFPSPLFPNLIYGPNPLFGVPPGNLSLTTAMSSSEFGQLQQLSSDSSYLAAIQTLHNSTAPSEVALAALPAASLQATFNYAGQITQRPSALYSAGQVTYTGSMADNYRANLNFSSDPTYQTAIDAVYEMRTVTLPLGTAPEVVDFPHPGISRHISGIVAALGISAQDLALLRTYTKLADPPPPSLVHVQITVANLSTLSRYAFLARGLGLSVSDLLSVIALIGVDPFQQTSLSPAQTLDFVQAVQTIQASPFSISQLNYLYRHVFDPDAGIAPLAANVNLLLTTLQTGLAGVAHDNAILPDPKGALLTKNLAVLLGANLATAAAGLITGTAVYSAPLASLPIGVNFPVAIPLSGFVSYDVSAQTFSMTPPKAMTTTQQVQLLSLSRDPSYQTAVNSLFASSQTGGYSQPLAALPMVAGGAISYDAAAQQLRFTGAMASADLATLQLLSSDASYLTAIANLRQQPVDLINANFQSFLAPNNLLTNVTLAQAATQLIDNPNNLSSAQKIAWVTKLLMPYLQRTLSKSLITQTLCDNLGLDPRLGGLLLNTILKSQVNPATAHAVDDFLALVGDGLTGAYYANGNLSGNPAFPPRIDATIDFEWGFGFPDPSIVAHSFSVRWTGWLLPQYSETYAFYVEAANVMNLQVGGQSVINQQSGATSGSIALTAGQLYQVELDYYDIQTGPVVRLSWQSPSTPKALIPQSQLFSGAVIQSLAPVVNAYTLLYKVNLLAATFSLTYADVAYFFQYGLDFKGVDPTDPSKFVPFDLNYLPLVPPANYNPATFNQWQRLNAVVNLRSGLPGGDAGLLNIFAIAATGLTSTPQFVTYSALTETLSIQGAMTAAEQAQLLALSHDLNYQAAVNGLFAASQAGGEAIYSQPLAALPSIAPPQLTPHDPLTAAIVQATGWNAADFVFLIGGSGFGLTYADFRNEAGTKGIGLVQLQACARLLGRLGVSAEQRFSWSAFAPDPANVAADIQNTVKAKYSDATWVTVGKPLNDFIREASKQALIAYILASAAGSLPVAQNWNMAAPDDGGPITTADQLYEFFLIDVEMSPCMLTSRIVQANAAIQLFVQRCLLNLEYRSGTDPWSVSPVALDTTVWEWMQNFRVWQANVQVLYHPENWMVPTLRDDKTPFFKDLENTLLQAPINSDTVTQAYLDYLTALDTVARLDIRGTYWQLSDGSPAPDGTVDAAYNVLHVFGRTQTKPYKYYYRRLLNCSFYGTLGGGAIWTPWEEVGVDIEGDHLVPVVWDGRLYLFWPSFAQSSEPSNQSAFDLPQQGQQNYSPPAPVMDLVITLNWSEYKQSAWTSKRSSDPLRFANFQNTYGISPPGLGGAITALGGSTLDVSQFSFNSSLADDGSLAINIYGWIGGWAIVPFGTSVWFPAVVSQIGQFLFSQCGGSPSSQTYAPSIGPVYPPLPYGAGDAADPTTMLYNSVWGGAAGNPAVTGLEMPLGMNLPSAAALFATPQPGSPAPAVPWTLMFPQQFAAQPQDSLPFDNFGLMLPTPIEPVADGQNLVQPGKPFFYRDYLESYFVTEKFDDGSIAINDVNSESRVYSRSSLIATPQIGNVGVIFPTKVVAHTGEPALAPGRDLGAGIAAPTSLLPLASPMDAPANNQGGLSQIQFSMFYHPFACAFIETINRYGVPRFLSIDTQARTNESGVISGFIIFHDPSGSNAVILSPGILVTTDTTGHQHLFEATIPTLVPAPPGGGINLYYNPQTQFYYSGSPSNGGDAFIGSFVYPFAFQSWMSTGPTVFENSYKPNVSYIAPYSFPYENVDFSPTGAYSIYNWELFFHIPLLIATQLSANQQFKDAETWFHYIFNPISSSPDPIPQRYWNFLPFYECGPWDNLFGQFLLALGLGLNLCGQGVQDQVSTWQKDPFNPFAIGRLRTIAFRMKVVMAYLDNKIAWGDNLFAQNTRESINEATQHYVMAKELLGPRPIQIPQQGTTQDYSYNDLVTLFGIDALGNALVLIENDVSYAAGYGGSASPGLGVAIAMSNLIPYFCLPANETLDGYWDTVDDRLYKIRHCMNIQGVVQQLPLFAPPISPALLVAAQAAGVDLSSVLSNINAATPCYRFSVMVQKALELCEEVRSLGTALLSALEKQDAEALSLLRATQETQVLQAMQQMKEWAVQEAQATLSGLEASQKTAKDRQTYYLNLVPMLIDQETKQADALAQAASQFDAVDSALVTTMGDYDVPDMSVGVAGFGGSPSANCSTISGSRTAARHNLHVADAQNTVAEYSNAASQYGLQAGWYRRKQEWGFQADQAADEIAQIAAQISAASSRVQIAQQDQANLDTQIQNAQKVQDFLSGKYTNQQLYSWMVDQISKAFLQCYQMAYNLATQAEAGFRFERCLATSNYIQFGHWDSLKKGLMSGERLYADLKTMELAFMQTDFREYEISKSVSLVLFDPWALINLKETGQCIVNLPEAFFDMDYPGHYFRRLKSVSLTIPCVTGPYTSVNCTLTLLNSKIRVDTVANNPQDYASDAHFITNYAATQSIATSTAQNDSGMFEVNFRDERYLPFEGAGLISTWRIDMPIDCNAFDFESITDIIINLRYTALYGSDDLRDIARKGAVIPPRPQQSFSGGGTFPSQSNLQRLFSLKHEFPTDWYRFLHPADDASSQSMQITLDNSRFPYQYRGKKVQILNVELIILVKPDYLSKYQGGSPLAVTLTRPPPPPSPPPPPLISLTSTPGYLNGAGYALLPLPTPGTAVPVTWVLQATSDAIGKTGIGVQVPGTTINHISPDAVTDMLLVCSYSTKP